MDTNEIEVYDFGLRIKKLRQEHHLTQAELARRLGTTKGTIYKYESNTQTPTIEKTKQMAGVLHVSTDYLLGLDNDPSFKIQCLDDEQRHIMSEFIRVFIDRKN